MPSISTVCTHNDHLIFGVVSSPFHLVIVCHFTPAGQFLLLLAQRPPVFIFLLVYTSIKGHCAQPFVKFSHFSHGSCFQLLLACFVHLFPHPFVFCSQYRPRHVLGDLYALEMRNEKLRPFWTQSHLALYVLVRNTWFPRPAGGCFIYCTDREVSASVLYEGWLPQ